METTVIIAIFSLLAAPFAAFITWILSRQKSVGEIYNILSESSQTAVETMQITMQELRIELVEAKDKIDLLLKENIELRKDLQDLKKQNATLISENVAFKKQIEDLSQTIKGLHL